MYIYVSSFICIYVTLFKGIYIMLQLNLKCKFIFVLRCWRYLIPHIFHLRM
jgi:hypothetical protein